MKIKRLFEAITYLEEALKQKEKIKEPLFFGGVLWYLYVASQATIDIGLKLITRLNLPPPETYKGVFDTLYHEHVVTNDLKEKLIELVKFRNYLAHVYNNLQEEIILESVTQTIENCKEFISQVKNYCETQNIDIMKL